MPTACSACRRAITARAASSSVDGHSRRPASPRTTSSGSSPSPSRCRTTTPFAACIIEARNKAEGLFYSSDKAMAEFGAHAAAEEQSQFLATELAECRAALEADDLATVEDAVARLEVAAQRIGEAIYAAAESG